MNHFYKITAVKKGPEKDVTEVYHVFDVDKAFGLLLADLQVSNIRIERIYMRYPT